MFSTLFTWFLLLKISEVKIIKKIIIKVAGRANVAILIKSLASSNPVAYITELAGVLITSEKPFKISNFSKPPSFDLLF